MPKQMYGARLRRLFPDLAPCVDDLLLLEVHQLEGLLGRAPGRELAAVLHAHPHVRAHLERRHPPLAEALAELTAAHEALLGQELATAEDTLVWEIADEIVYQRAPETYDRLAADRWDPSAVLGLIDPTGLTVIDAGAGTGVVAFSLLGTAGVVYAVEPAGAMRRYMRQKAAASEPTGLYVLDGTLDAIPLPPRSTDLLITNDAIGWHPDEELAEVARVMRRGGLAVHLVGSPGTTDARLRAALMSAGYQEDVVGARAAVRQRYWRRSADGG